jgi:Zn-finger nucleic acid-binding protein
VSAYRTSAPGSESSRCPRDGEALERRDDVLPRLACPACDGCWLRREDLERLHRPPVAQRLGEHAQPPATYVPDPSRPLACLDCRARMDRFEFATSRVAVDRCREHGVWLDGHELEQVAAYLAKRPTPQAGEPREGPSDGFSKKDVAAFAFLDLVSWLFIWL